MTNTPTPQTASAETNELDELIADYEAVADPGSELDSDVLKHLRNYRALLTAPSASQGQAVAYYYELNGSDTCQVIFEPFPSEITRAWADQHGHKLHLLYASPPNAGTDAAREPFVLTMSAYEATNLRALLSACGYGSGCPGRNPLYAANTGDWLGQIFQKLPNLTDRPNKTAHELAEESKKSYWLDAAARDATPSDHSPDDAALDSAIDAAIAAERGESGK